MCRVALRMRKSGGAARGGVSLKKLPPKIRGKKPRPDVTRTLLLCVVLIVETGNPDLSAGEIKLKVKTINLV